MLRATQTINGKASISKQVLLLLCPSSPHCARLWREISRLWMPWPPQKGRPAGHRKGGLCSSNHPIKGTAHKLLPARGQGPLAFKNQMFLKCGWRHLLDCVTHRPLIFHQQEMTATLIVICAQCCVQTKWFGSVLIDSYQLIETVTAHLPGHLWRDLQTALQNQDLPEIRWVSRWLPSHCNLLAVGKKCSALIFLCGGGRCLLSIGQMWG